MRRSGIIILSSIGVLFTTHQLLQFSGHPSPAFANNYLDPFCFLPLVLSLWWLELKCLYGLKRLPLHFALLASTILVILAEVVFPRLNPGFVHDWWDYPAYLLGLLVFYLLINPPPAPQLPPAGRPRAGS